MTTSRPLDLEKAGRALTRWEAFNILHHQRMMTLQLMVALLATPDPTSGKLDEAREAFLRSASALDKVMSDLVYVDERDG